MPSACVSLFQGVELVREGKEAHNISAIIKPNL